MSWTMSRPVLQVVAGVLALGAAGAFTLGILNAPERGGRLPGERAAREAGGTATAINATEATPLSQERIEGPPPTVEKPAEKADDEDQADTGAQALNATSKTAEAATKPSAAAINATPPPQLDIQAPPPEEPPH